MERMHSADLIIQAFYVDLANLVSAFLLAALNASHAPNTGHFFVYHSHFHSWHSVRNPLTNIKFDSCCWYFEWPDLLCQHCRY